MSNHSDKGLSGPALWIGLMVIISWLGIVLWTILQRDVGEVEWTRLIFLLSSVEAVAFGAAGALFGTQIQRQRIEDAKERATTAEEEAADNKDIATKGRTLAALVKAQNEAEESPSAERRRLSTEGTHRSDKAVLTLANEILFGVNLPESRT